MRERHEIMTDAPRCGMCKLGNESELEDHVVCRFPVPDWMMRQLHDPMSGGGKFVSTMHKNDGTDCPCYERKRHE